MENKFWSKQVGDQGRNLSVDIKKVEDGFLLILWTEHASKIDDWHIVKLDSAGNILEEKFLGTEIDEELMCLEYINSTELAAISHSRCNDIDINFSVLTSNYDVTFYRNYELPGSDEIIREL